MKQLATNWITEGLMDIEYKKYLLLGYLQQVSKSFDEQKLYPLLADLITHYQNLVALKENKEKASANFSRKIKKIDLENFKIEYEKVMHDDRYMEEIEAILEFAIPKIQLHLSDGKKIYEYVEQNLQIFPIGIMPLSAEAGYMLLSNGNNSDTQVFVYEMTIFESANEKYRAIRTNYIDSYIKQFTNTFESIKIDLIKRHKNLPNPATFVISTTCQFPLQETFLPIAKRSFVRFLSKNVAL